MSAHATSSCVQGVTASQLSDWRAHAISGGESEQLLRHVATCVACQRTLWEFDQLAALLRREPVPEPATDLWRVLERRMSGQPMRVTRRRGHPAVFGSLATVAAIALLLIGYVAIFHALPAKQHVASTPTATASATATSQAAAWTMVTDSSIARQAPASITTVYRVQLGSTAGSTSNLVGTQLLQRSDDAGLTWATMAWPNIAGVTLPANLTEEATTTWSPRAPMTLFLGLTVKNDALCPAPDVIPIPVINGIARATSTTGTLCEMTEVTTDGGATWRPLTPPSPLTGTIGGISDESALVTAKSVRVQGARIYALFTASLQASMLHGRLAVSDDGGATWRLVDLPIASAGQTVVDYALPPSGQTLFALTTPAQSGDAKSTLPPVQFWSSQDGGATWARGGTPPGQRMDALSAAVDPSTGVAVAYLLSDSSNDIDLHLYASLDGGRSWPHAVDLHTEQVGPPGSPTLLTPLPTGAIVIDDGSGLGTPTSNGAQSPTMGALSAWSYTLDSLRMLTQPSAVSQVTQVDIQTLPGGRLRLWLAGEGVNSSNAQLAYVDLPQ